MLELFSLQFGTPCSLEMNLNGAADLIAPRIPPGRAMDNGVAVPKSTTRGPLDGL